MCGLCQYLEVRFAGPAMLRAILAGPVTNPGPRVAAGLAHGEAAGPSCGGLHLRRTAPAGAVGLQTLQTHDGGVEILQLGAKLGEHFVKVHRTFLRIERFGANANSDDT